LYLTREEKEKGLDTMNYQEFFAFVRLCSVNQ